MIVSSECYYVLHTMLFDNDNNNNDNNRSNAKQNQPDERKNKIINIEWCNNFSTSVVFIL